MALDGLADHRREGGGEVIEFYPSRVEAEAALWDVLSDEPHLTGELGVVPVEFTFSIS
jgi:hypothetical protein